MSKSMLRTFAHSVRQGVAKELEQHGAPPKLAWALASKFLSSLTRMNGHKGRAMSLTVLADIADSMAYSTSNAREATRFGHQVCAVAWASRGLPKKDRETYQGVRLPKILTNASGEADAIEIAPRRVLGMTSAAAACCGS